MQNDAIDIATAHSCEAKSWKNKKIKWTDLVVKLSKAQATLETFKEYQAATKDVRGKIKDVGGYFGGYLRNGKRSPANVVLRQLVTLDIDFGHINFWEDFKMQFNCEAILHSTHSHSAKEPRFRLILPLSKSCSPEEYQAISRKVAGLLGIEYFDDTTFEINRLMFWPSVSNDVEYYIEHQKGEWLDVDSILDLYVDWKDQSSWPRNADKDKKTWADADKQEDPHEKKGLIGVFCREYSISDAIENFLSDKYTKGTDNRYTYVKGSTANGLVIYEDKFAYSHHNTDPCSELLTNAFDLVRIHKFGKLDANSASKKSLQAMENFVQKDPRSKKRMAKELLKKAKGDFNDSETFVATENVEKEAEWMATLEADAKGNYLSTSTNLNTIFRNDAILKEVFAKNVFDQKRYITRSLPWRTVADNEPMKDVDYAGIRNYIECLYGISNPFKIEDALALEIERHSFHPICDYLQSLDWDGKERINTLLIDYFGAEDTIYTRAAIRKTLVAAVARVFEPGCKFDMVLTLVGTQTGEGKSFFLKKLGKQWFSDTFLTVHGKEALEQIQGVWIIEMAELSGLRKADVESVKHFITKQDDTFRAAYARTAETYKRQCIFIGTTNRDDFLRDPTGNRRFNPVKVVKPRATKNVFTELTNHEVDQIWAEAYQLYVAGESLYLNDEEADLAKQEQTKHSESDERAGLIIEYLDTKLPENWADMGLDQRLMYLDGNSNITGTVERDYVCMAEIWCECLRKDKNEMTRYNTRDLNDILRGLSTWESKNSTRNFPIFGKQKYFERRLY